MHGLNGFLTRLNNHGYITKSKRTGKMKGELEINATVQNFGLKYCNFDEFDAYLNIWMRLKMHLQH